MAANEGKVLIVGLGASGLSVARFFAARGIAFDAADSRSDPPGLSELRDKYPRADAYLGPFSAGVFTRYAQLVVSPGVAMREPAIQAALAGGAEVIGDIELFARAAKAPAVGITGSNGKSTVTTLVGEMARHAGVRVAVGGNLGTPALDLITNPEVELYVLEISSFQLETTHTLALRVATILNLSPDHMDRYDSMDEYAAAKARIFTHAQIQVVNREDALAAALARDAAVVSFGLDAPDPGQYGLRERDGQMWLACGEDCLLPESALRIPGRHNTANALAALALAETAGLPRAAALAALREFAGLPHRTQWVARLDGVDWYNDSKGTNVGATLAALNGMPRKVVLLAGGLGKGQDFTLLREGVMAKARAVVLFGHDAPLIEAALAGTVPLVHADSLAEAVDRAAEFAQPGDAVLLSPACASFDMFTGYVQRGEVFTRLVQERAA